MQLIIYLSDTAMILIVLYIHFRTPNTDVTKNRNCLLRIKKPIILKDI